MASHCTFCCVLLNMLLVLTSCTKLCPRIFFQNINEDTMPYKMIEGVYINKKNDFYNNFPVYRRENNDRDLGLYNYHNDENGDKLLVFGNEFGDGSLVQFGAAARLSNDPLSWLSSGTLNKSDVFNGLVDEWQYYNTSDHTDYNVPITDSSPMIKAVCVDEDFRECNSDRVYLNERIDERYGMILNDPTTDYFHRIEGLFPNLRPVYKHSAVSWYLQYVDSYWVISESYRPSNSEENVIMRVKDLALRPEYITNTWSRWSFGWHNMPGLRVLCRGVTSMHNICPSNPCESSATCFNSTTNETLCLCPSGFTGLTCSVNKQCPPSKEFEYLGQRPGDLGMSFCSDSVPSTRFYLCVDGNGSSRSYWSRQFVGSDCKEQLAENSTSVATEDSAAPDDPTQALLKSNPVKFGDDPLLVLLVIYIAVFMQICLPFVVWCCVACKRKRKEARVEHSEMEHSDVGGRHRQIRRSTGGNEELEKGIHESQRKHEIKEKPFFKSRNVRFIVRLISLHMYFSFYLWLIFLLGCEASQCTTHGEVFFILRVFAIVMLCVCPVIVLLESFFCKELNYLRNIIEDETAAEYIQRMREVTPKIDMVVECYHYKDILCLSRSCGNKNFPFHRKKIVTYVDRDVISFDSWVDITKTEMLAETNKPLTRVQIDTSIHFGDQETADAYATQMAEMVQRNKRRDVFTEFKSTKEVPGLKKRICAFANLSVKPFWFRPLFFWIATLLQMTWPYRWVFWAKTDNRHYVLKSMVYKNNRNNNNSATQPGKVEPNKALVGIKASCVVEVRDQDNTGTGHPVSTMTATGNPTLNPYLGQGNEAQSPNAEALVVTCLEEPHPNAARSS